MVLIQELPTTDYGTTDYGDLNFMKNMELYARLKLVRNSTNMAPFELKPAELESYESQLFYSANFNSNGLILAELWTNLSQAYNSIFS